MAKGCALSPDPPLGIKLTYLLSPSSAIFAPFTTPFAMIPLPTAAEEAVFTSLLFFCLVLVVSVVKK